MTLTELLAEFRTAVDDLVAPYLWSDVDVSGYLADAESEACIRARLIVDETTADVAVVLIGTDAWVDLAPSVIEVSRAWLASNPDNPLRQCPPDELDRIHPGWESQTGTPTQYYVCGRRLRLIPQPTAASGDTLHLRLFRTPLVPLSTSSIHPEIPEQHHRRLLDWAFHMAFSRRDVDQFDPRRADLHRQIFENWFGPRPSGSAIRKQMEKRWPIAKPIRF